MDDDGSRSLSWDEFKKGVDECSITLTPGEIEQLFQKFKGDNESISIDELIVNIQPPMNETRRDIVNLVFNKLDRTGDGTCTPTDLKDVYNAKKHRKYINGEWTEEQVLKDFLMRFDSPENPDGVLTRDEFMSYYSGLSASIDNDYYFELMLRKAWKL